MEFKCNHDMNWKKLNAKIKGDIKKIGWSIIGVIPTEEEPVTPFAYTIGLKESYNHPELFMEGLSPDVMAMIINNVGMFIKEGKKFTNGKLITGALRGNYKLKAIKFDTKNYSEQVTQAFNYYDTEDVGVLQLLWPDTEGHFPDSKKYNVKKYHTQKCYGVKK